jgi:hypothetical protein
MKKGTGWAPEMKVFDVESPDKRPLGLTRLSGVASKYCGIRTWRGNMQDVADTLQKGGEMPLIPL